MRFPPCAVVVSAVLLGSAAAPAGAATHDIATIGSPGSYAYDPTALRIPAGDIVRWRASGTHPLVFDTGGGPFTTNQERTLTTPSVIAFHCSNHGAAGGVGMSGAVTVDAPPTIRIERQTVTPRAGEPVAFRANASDPEGKLVRIDWDLDGDDAFENGNAGPTASASYAAGEHTISARAVDDLGASATASHSFTVPSAGGGGPGASTDTEAPSVILKAPRSIRAKQLRKCGVKLTLTASEDGRFVATLRKRSGRRLGRTTAKAAAGQATVLRVRARRARPRRLKLRIVAIDLAGNRTAVKRRLTVR